MSVRSHENGRARGAGGRSAPSARPSDVIVTVLFSVALTVAGAWAFWPVYRTPWFFVVVTVTTLVGTALALAAWRWRWPSAVVTLATIAAFLVLGVPLAVPDAALYGVLPSLDGIVQLLGAVALSWKQLVTISVPVGSYEALMTPLFVLTLVSSVLGTTIALRAPKPEFAVVPGIVFFLCGIVFGPSVVEATVLPAAALFALTIGWLTWFTQRKRLAQLRALRSRSRSRRSHRAPVLLVGASVVAVSVVAGTVVATITPASAARDVLRLRVEQPFDPRDYPSPLSSFRNNFTAEQRDETMLTVSGVERHKRVRIATLDTYNGVVYSVGASSQASGTFTRVPYRFEQSNVIGTARELAVTIGGYSGVWVPAGGQLQDARFSGARADPLRDGLVYNDVTGTIASIAGLARGDRYVVDEIVKPEVVAASLAYAQPGAAALPKLTGVPDELEDALQRYTKDITGAGPRLAAALEELAREGYVSHGQSDEVPSRSGHGEDRIAQLFTESPMVGDQEQYAVAAALMARRIGFPARVVVGYVVPQGSGDGPVELTGADASAWIEIDTKTDGWVSVDPNPAPRPVPDSQRETETRVIRPQSVVDPPPDDDTTRRDATAQSDTEEPPNDVDPLWAVIAAVLLAVGSVALVLALIAAPFVLILAAKARRRALRRRAATARDSVVAGWHELADTAVDFGYVPSAGATRSEFAGQFGTEFDDDRALRVATAADRAVFATGAPSDDEAERQWRTVLKARDEMAASRSRWQRWRAALSLRSLGWRSPRSHSGYRGRETRGTTMPRASMPRGSMPRGSRGEHE